MSAVMRLAEVRDMGIRVPPHSNEAEQAVLGGLMLAPDKLDSIADKLAEDDFYRKDHRMIWRAINELSLRGQPCDAVTLGDWFETNGLAQMMGGPAYLVELANTTPSAANIGAYAQIIREKSVRRQMIDKASELVERAWSADGDTVELLDAGISGLMGLQRVETRYEYTLRQAMTMAYKDAQEARERGTIPGISTGLTMLDRALGGFHDTDLIVIGARPAMGKAQPLSSRVLLASGEWKHMGDVSIGDSLASTDGRPSHVSAVYPQGMRQIKRIIFDDGREVRCDAEHLWSVECCKWTGARILTTDALASLIERSTYRNRIHVTPHDGNHGIRWNGMNPWLIGFLIGDGSLSRNGVSFSTSEQYILDRVSTSIPEGHAVIHASKYDYRISAKWKNVIVNELVALGLKGKRAEEKSIPESIFFADFATRMSVLCGLIESDGWVQDASVQYSTASNELADGIARLVWSLGGKCHRRLKRNIRYEYRGEMRSGLDAHCLSIAIPGLSNYIKSPRIREKLTARRKTTAPIIRAIIDDGVELAQCIKVTHPSSLYLTDGYIVTHNTALLMNFVAACSLPCGIISAEMPVNQVGGRLMSIKSHVPAELMRTGRFEVDHLRRLEHGISELSDRVCLIYDRSSPTDADVARMARKWVRDHGIRALYIDYTQRIRASRISKNANRAEKVGEVVRTFKEIARELSIPVIALAQVGRQAEGRQPTMADLSDSSEIEKEADQVITLDRPHEYDESQPECLANLSIEKNRHGPTWKIKAAWLPETMRFEDYEESDYA